MTTAIITIAIAFSMLFVYDSYRDDEMHRHLREIKKENAEEMRRAKNEL